VLANRLKSVVSALRRLYHSYCVVRVVVRYGSRIWRRRRRARTRSTRWRRRHLWARPARSCSKALTSLNRPTATAVNSQMLVPAATFIQRYPPTPSPLLMSRRQQPSTSHPSVLSRSHTSDKIRQTYCRRSPLTPFTIRHKAKRGWGSNSGEEKES